MKNNALTNAVDPDRVDFDRRYFLSLPVLVGGMVMLNDPVNASSFDLSALMFIQEHVSVADSVTLYTNLLPDIRKVKFQQKLQEIGLLKQLASGRLELLITSADRLGGKYRNATAASSPEMLTDFRMLIDQVENTWQVKRVIERSENELPQLEAINTKIDSIHSHLLKASEHFTKTKNHFDVEGENKANADGKAELRKAIKTLEGLLKRKINESELNSPIERLIVLLLGVEFAVGKEKPNISTGFQEKSYHSHHARVLPASSIMQVLRKHVRPGSWLQMGIGYSVAFPVLLRNSNQEIRKKLLMDGLRLVPGLVPSPLEDAAKDLAALSL